MWGKARAGIATHGAGGLPPRGAVEKNCQSDVHLLQPKKKVPLMRWYFFISFLFPPLFFFNLVFLDVL
jgi:hypothetical protein